MPKSSNKLNKDKLYAFILYYTNAFITGTNGSVKLDS